LPTLPLGASAIDRNAVSRSNPNLIDDLLTSGEARILFLRGTEVRLHEESAGLQLLLAPASAASETQRENLFYLGTTTTEGIDFDYSVLPAGTSILAQSFDQDSKDAPSGNWHNLRRVSNALTPLDAGIFSQASALANWHRTHKHCPACGSANVVADAGWSRVCVACSKQVFPRTDPAIIVAVRDEQDRLLLGSQGSWSANRWSVLAGFVEAGESLNAAVEREVFEEAGIRVSEIEFLGSQPWPFPYSLMFGFSARAVAGSVAVPDGDEIVRLRWFSREELLSEVAQLELPGRLSIARALIEEWLGSSLEDAVQGGGGRK
jgi:NAD+ diphosphatase